MADDGEIHIDHTSRFLDQLIVEPLMVPLDSVTSWITTRGPHKCGLDARIERRPPFMSNTDPSAAPAGAETATEVGDQVSPDFATQSFTENLPDFGDWLPEAVVPFWDLVSRIPIVGAAIIALAFFLLAFALRFAIFRSLGRLAQITTSTFDDRLL
jgi:hypothetical protein